MLPTADQPDTSSRSRRHRRTLIVVALAGVITITGTVIAIATADGNRSGSFDSPLSELVGNTTIGP